MVRSTETLIKLIIEVDEEISNLSPFMEAAHQIVERNCSGLTEDVATMVETWLSAHLITIRDMRPSSEKIDEITVSYQYKVGLGLNSSMYGQTAMNLDYTGGLARWNKQVTEGNAGKVSSVIWLGSDK